MPDTTCHMSISLDGFVAGPDQSREHPLGIRGREVHAWHIGDERANEADVMNIVGDVDGKNCLIIDDMCDTGGTITKVAEALNKAGAKDVYAFFTHAVLSGKAAENISGSHLKKVIVTNTIPLCRDVAHLQEEGRIEVLSVGKLLTSAIRSIHDETSVSSLFI